MRKKLTVQSIDALKPTPGSQVDYFDTMTPGFGVRVSERGTKTFVYLYSLGGKVRRMKIGRYPEMSLAKARTKASDIRDAVREGRDPRVEKQQQKIEEARKKGDIYAAAVEDFIKRYAIGEKHNRSFKEQRRLLFKVNEGWHDISVSSITSREIRETLEAIRDDGHGYAANRAFEVLRTFFKWLEYDERVTVDPMRKVRNPFGGEQARERVWTNDELRRIWLAADKLGKLEAPYLKLLLLLGQRRDEVAGIRWDEITEKEIKENEIDGRQFKGLTWQLPAIRGKSKRLHTFPLSNTAIEILNAVPRVNGSAFVFPGRGTRDGKPCPMTVGRKLQERIQKASRVSDFTFHDARRTFGTGLAALNIAPHIRAECLNHARRGVSDIHYQQDEYLPEQFSAFQAWDNHIAKLTGRPKDNVTGSQRVSARSGQRRREENNGTTTG
jgi:integrase